MRTNLTRLPNREDPLQMKTVTCDCCQKPLPRHEAVARGDSRIVRYWHPDCFTVARAVFGVAVAEQRVTQN